MSLHASGSVPPGGCVTPERSTIHQSQSTSARQPNHVHEVWNFNFGQEIEAFLSAVNAAGANVAIMLDVCFPTLLRKNTSRAARARQHEVLCENVNLFQPVQIGLAVADASSKLQGAWNFNLLFDVQDELQSGAIEQSLDLASIDFAKHAHQGVDPQMLGSHLQLAGCPLWVTYDGSYSFGYLVSIMTCQPLPDDHRDYDACLAALCPRILELKCDQSATALSNILDRRSEECGAGCKAVAVACMYCATKSTPGSARSMHPVPAQPAEAVTVAACVPATMDESEPRSNSTSSSSSSWAAAARRSWAMIGEHEYGPIQSPFVAAVTREAASGGA